MQRSRRVPVFFFVTVVVGSQQLLHCTRVGAQRSFPLHTSCRRYKNSWGRPGSSCRSDLAIMASLTTCVRGHASWFRFVRPVLKLVVAVAVLVSPPGVHGAAGLATAKKISAIFMFGDSIVDPGNNNHRFTEAKANFPPYGQDFPGGVATGRFSNGLVPGDLLGMLRSYSVYVSMRYYIYFLSEVLNARDRLNYTHILLHNYK